MGDKCVDIVKFKFVIVDDVVFVVDNIYKDGGKGSILEFLIFKVVVDGCINSVIVSGEV